VKEKEWGRGRDKGGCSLKRMFVVGLNRVLGGGVTQACAGSGESRQYGRWR